MSATSLLIGRAMQNGPKFSSQIFSPNLYFVSMHLDSKRGLSRSRRYQSHCFARSCAGSAGKRVDDEDSFEAEFAKLLPSIFTYMLEVSVYQRWVS